MVVRGAGLQKPGRLKPNHERERNVVSEQGCTTQTMGMRLTGLANPVLPLWMCVIFLLEDALPERDLARHSVHLAWPQSKSTLPRVLMDTCFGTKAWSSLDAWTVFPSRQKLLQICTAYKISSLVVGAQQVPNCFSVGCPRSRS